LDEQQCSPATVALWWLATTWKRPAAPYKDEVGWVLTVEEEECGGSGDLNRFQPALVLGRWTNGGGGGRRAAGALGRQVSCEKVEVEEGLSCSVALHTKEEEENGGGSGGRVDGRLRRCLVRWLTPGASSGAGQGERRGAAATDDEVMRMRHGTRERRGADGWAQVAWVALGLCRGSGPAVERKKRAEPKVTMQFFNYSNIFKRLELI
jgi:hypothetical protein